ncbi:MAG: helix-turn-helix domain-containing protein [Peptostreptococcaceae bacterium]
MARGKSITTSQKILIAKLYIEGKTYGEISEEIGLSKISILRCVNHDNETMEMIEQLEQKIKNEIFNKCIDTLKEGYKDVEIDGKTSLEMILEGYNK